MTWIDPDATVRFMAIQTPEAVEQPRADGAPRRLHPGWWIALGAAATGLIIWLLTFTETDLRDRGNPNPPDPLPGEGMWGLSDSFWIDTLHIATAVMCVGMVIAFLVHRRGGEGVHPGFGVFLGLTTIIAYDPIFNWAMYAVYNPKLRHWPVTWEWANISPSVEPLWPLGAYPFFFLTPGLIAFYLHRRFVVRRAGPGSFTFRRPMWSLFLFAIPVCLVLECVGESLLLQFGMWTYYQYWGPALHVGDSWLPVTEIVLATVTMSFLGLLMYRDDRGHSVCKRIGMRFRLGEKVTAVLLIQAVFICYIGFFAVVRVAGLADNTAGEWPYRVMKTYDPDGVVKDAGEPGPYYRGVWAGYTDGD